MASCHIVVAGPMGAGKSTLTKALAAGLGYVSYLESAGDRNPFLADFYDDMSRWAFHSQTFFAVEALRQQHEIATLTGGAVQDRSIWEHLWIFGTGLREAGHLSDVEFEVLSDLVATSTASLPAPDLLLYVHAPFEEIKARVIGRGRDYEADVDPEYLRAHCDAYEPFIASWTRSPVLTVNSAEIDVRRPQDLQQLLGEVRAKLSAAATRSPALPPR